MRRGTERKKATIGGSWEKGTERKGEGRERERRGRGKSVGGVDKYINLCNVQLILVHAVYLGVGGVKWLSRRHCWASSVHL